MLLDEDPAKLLKECRSNFNLPPDRAALSRISSSLSTLSQARSLRLNAAETQLKRLNRQRSTLAQQHALAVSAHDAPAHAAAIMALDTQKFRVAKEASDLEVEGERLEAELRGAEGALRDVEAQGVAGARAAGAVGRGSQTVVLAASADQDVLRLKLYRSLGIEVEADGKGGFGKAIVRSARRGTAQVVDLDPRFSRTFYANHFWQAV